MNDDVIQDLKQFISATVSQQMSLQFGELREEINQRFDEQDKKFNDRFDAVNNRFDDVNDQFKSVNDRFDDINDRFRSVNNRFDAINDRFDEQDEILNEILNAVGGSIQEVEQKVDDHEIRLKRLERKAA